MNYLTHFSRSRISLIFVFLSIPSFVFADGVSVDDAKAKALNFINKSISSNSKSFAKARTEATTVLNLVYTANKNDVPTLYAFNVNDNDGFVVVSGNNKSEEILGYSDKGTFNYTSMPKHVKWWIDNISQQVLLASQMASEQNAKASNKEAEPYYANWEPIKPLLTSAWGQTEPYNLYTPYVNEAKHSPTGCVATAMAQIMHANKYPEHGYGSHSYTMKSYMTGNDTTLTADFGQHVYNWEAMDYNYSYNYHSNGKGVSQLMSDCGIATEMKYGFAESSTFAQLVPSSLINYFGYDSHTVRLDKSSFDIEQWGTLIYDALRKGLPVFYSGMSFLGGHAFVCDGYSSDNFFHFDFGWDGQYNGYFKLSAIKANQGGYDSGYNKYESAVLAFPFALSDNYPYSVLFNSYSVVIDENNRDTGYISMYTSCTMPYNKTFELIPGIQLIDENGKEHCFWSEKKINTEPESNDQFSYKIPLSVLPETGTFTILPVYKDKDNNIYDTKHQYSNFPKAQYFITCNNDIIKLGEKEQEKGYQLEMESIQVPSFVYANHGFSLRTVIKNTGKIDFYNSIGISYIDKKTNTLVDLRCDALASVKAESDNMIVLSCSQLDIQGTYDLCLTENGNPIENSTFKLTIKDGGISGMEDVPNPYSYNGLLYRINGNMNAVVVGPSETVTENDAIVIPEYIVVNGNSLMVTEIGPSAFAGVTARLIDIPKTVTFIDAVAFMTCNANIKVHWESPLLIDEGLSCFGPQQPIAFSLDVPEGTASLYAKAAGWKQYHTITENGEIKEYSISLNAYATDGGGEIITNGHGQTLGDYQYFTNGDIVTMEFIPYFTNSVVAISDYSNDYMPLLNQDKISFQMNRTTDLEIRVSFGDKYGDAYYMAISPNNAIVIDHASNNFYHNSTNTIEFSDKVSIGGKEYDVINFADNISVHPNTEVIKVNWEEPFELNEIAFNNDVFQKCILDVPVGCSEKYASTKGWKKFSRISERGVMKRDMVVATFTDSYNCLPPFFHLYVNNEKIESSSNVLVAKGSNAEISIKKDEYCPLYKLTDGGIKWGMLVEKDQFNYENIKEDSLSFDKDKWSLEYLFVNGVDLYDKSSDNWTVTISNVSENLQIVPKVVYKDEGVCYHPVFDNIVHLTLYDENDKFIRTDTIYGAPYSLVTWGRYKGDVKISDKLLLGNNFLSVSHFDNECFMPTWPEAFLFEEVNNNYTIPISVEIPDAICALDGTCQIYLPYLRKLIVNWQTPINISSNVFFQPNSVHEDNSIFKNCTLVVPKGTLSAYAADPVWGLFEKIVDEDIEVLIGDVNNDNKVNITDVVDIINDCLGYKSENYVHLWSDVNNDSQYTIADATAVINIMYGEPIGSDAKNTNKVSDETLAFYQSGVRTLSLDMNSMHSYSSFQFDIDLPEGLTIDIENIVMNSSRTKDFSVQFSKTSNNHYKVVAFNFQNGSVTTGSGNLLKINMKSPGDCGNIRLSNIHFSTRKAEDVHFNDLSLSSSPTGINNVYDNHYNNSDVYYNISGQRITKPVKGLYIQNGIKVILY